MTEAPSSTAAAASAAAGSAGGDAGAVACNLRDFPIYAVGERDAMSVNMRNAGLEQLNEKYMTHLRNSMRREVSLINVSQRSLLNRFNSYSMTMVADSLATTGRDRRSYLQYLKARQQQTEETFPLAMSAGSQDPLTRARTFIDSQRVGNPEGRTDGASLERLKLLTRPPRSHQQGVCPRLKAAPVGQVHPEFAPSLRKAARVRTAPTPSYLLRLHYQRVEEERLREQLPNERRAHSTLGFSVQDASLRRRALEDSRFVRLRQTLVAPKQQLQLQQQQQQLRLESEDM